jgi:integrase
VMLAMSYDAALRREEICSLETTDIDPAHRLLRIRLEATKGRRERIVPYSVPTTDMHWRMTGAKGSKKKSGMGSYGTITTGARQNVAFCPVGSNTVT